MPKPRRRPGAKLVERRVRKQSARANKRWAPSPNYKTPAPFYARRSIFLVIGALVLASFLVIPALPVLVGGVRDQRVTPEPEPVPTPVHTKSYSEPFPVTIDAQRSYRATVETEDGPIRLELFSREAPNTVNNFINLAREGFYDGVPFHRVLPGFAAQAGDPTGLGGGGPGYEIPDENLGQLIVTGTLAMANRGPNTNGSQFFIAFGPQPNLDGKYSVFGRVLEGMDVLAKLRPRDPLLNPRYPGTAISRVVIEEGEAPGVGG